MKSTLFVSKSDSHERRSTNILKISTSVARTSLGKNILVTDSIFEGLSPANTTDAPPLNFLNKNISVLTHK